MTATVRSPTLGAVDAIVWRRSDFRESSRLITFFTRERGRVTALAKGAHRANSSLLGRVDFLNVCDVSLRGRGLPIVSRLRLVHEPRGLRRGARFLAIAYFVELVDRTLVDGRADPELYDLVIGASAMCERAPVAHLPHCLLGLELRLLRALGQAPALDECSECGASTEELYASSREIGLYDREHAPRGSRRVPAPTLGWLRTLAGTAGKRWPSLRPSANTGVGLRLTGAWLSVALEHRARLREPALRAVGT